MYRIFVDQYRFCKDFFSCIIWALSVSVYSHGICGTTPLGVWYYTLLGVEYLRDHTYIARAVEANINKGKLLYL